MDLRANAMNGTLHFLKLQHYWSLTIRLFSVISRTLVGGGLPLCRDAVSVFYSPSQLSEGQFVIAARRAFRFHFMFRLNDVVPD